MHDKENTQEEINRLHRLLQDKDKEFEKAKGKRAIITILAFAVGYFWLFAAQNGIPTRLEIVLVFVEAIFISGIHFYINSLVFSFLVNKGRAEQEILKNIEKQLREIERQ